MVSIYAGVNGYLDKIEVEAVTRFEEALLTEVRNKHKAILKAIREEQEISDETNKKLKSLLDKFTKTFA